MDRRVWATHRRDSEPRLRDAATHGRVGVEVVRDAVTHRRVGEGVVCDADAPSRDSRIGPRTTLALRRISSQHPRLS